MPDSRLGLSVASPEALDAVRYLRSRATDLRKQADFLNREADLLEQRLAPGLLKGRKIVDAVVGVLEADEVRGPWHRGVHYKDLLPMIERDGRRVRGVDPAATLLTNLHRDPRVELAEPDSGRFRLAVTVTEAVAQVRLPSVDSLNEED